MCKHYESNKSYRDNDQPGGVCRHPKSEYFEVQEGCRCELFALEDEDNGSPGPKVGGGACVETGEGI